MPTLEDLKAQHLDWCFKCGATRIPQSIQCSSHNPVISALIAAKLEDEKEIEGLSRKLDETFCEAHRQGSYLRDQLSAAQQAHEETKRMLLKVCRSAYSFTIGKDELECLNNRLDNVWEAVEEADEYLARQASINRPTDKQPTDDREPNKEGDRE